MSCPINKPLEDIPVPEQMDVDLFVPQAHARTRAIMVAHGGDLGPLTNMFHPVVATFPKGTVKRWVATTRYAVIFPDGFHRFELTDVEVEGVPGVVLSLVADDSHGGQWPKGGKSQ